MQALNRYIDLLADEAQQDMAVFHNGWVVYPVVPIFIYICYAFIKWYILLMPVTLPITLWHVLQNRKSEPPIYKNN